MVSQSLRSLAIATFILLAARPCFAQSVNYSAGEWQEMAPGSVTGGGISGVAQRQADFPGNAVIAWDQADKLVVAWSHDLTDGSNIYVRRWDGFAWEDLGTTPFLEQGLDGSSQFAWNPQLAIDSLGNPMVLWSVNDNGTSNYSLHIRQWDGDSWQEVGAGSAAGSGLISDWTPTLGYSRLALDSNDLPWVVWTQQVSGRDRVYGKRFDGVDWIEISVGSSSGTGLAFVEQYNTAPDIAIDSMDRLVLLWSGRAGFFGQNRVFARRYSSGSFTALGTGGDTASLGVDPPRDILAPRLVLRSDNTPVIVAENHFEHSLTLDGYNSATFLRAYDLNGSSWTEMTNQEEAYHEFSQSVSGHKSINEFAQIGLTPEEDPIAVWHNNEGKIFARWRHGTQWHEMGAAGVVSSEGAMGHSLFADVAVSPSGRVAVAWTELLNENEWAIHLKEFIPGFPPEPAPFEASSISGGIALGWEMNGGEPVDGFLLVRREDQSFTIPADGITYPDGDTTGPGGDWCRNFGEAERGFIDGSAITGTPYFYRLYAHANGRFYSTPAEISYSLSTIDLTAPASPGDLRISAQNAVSLSWRDPLTDDLAGILIVRSEQAGGFAVVDGESYPEGADSGPDGSWTRHAFPGEEILIDSEAAAGKDYYYSLYAYDEALNYSGPAEISGRVMTFTEIGNPTTGEPPQAQSSRTLHTWNDRAYIGYGHWGINTGPTHVIAWNPDLDNFRQEFLLDQEGLDRYYTLDGGLWIPGIDQISGGFGHVYHNDGTGWVQRPTIPNTLHVYSVGEKDGFIYAGTRTNLSGRTVGSVFRSADKGQSWTRILDTETGFFFPAVYQIFALDDSLFAQGYYASQFFEDSGTGLQQIPQKLNLHGSDFIPGASYYLQTERFLGGMALWDKRGHWLMHFDGSQTVDISWSREFFVEDAKTEEGFLYILSLEPSGSQWRAMVHRTADFFKFHLVADVVLPTPPTTLALVDGRLLIGSMTGVYYLSDQVFDDDKLSILTNHLLPEADANIEYETLLESSGNEQEDKFWSLASPKAVNGINLSSSGVLSGLPASTGLSALTVEVAASDSLSVKPFVLTVNKEPVREETGLLVAEAEDFDAAIPGIMEENWAVSSVVSGYSGTGYIQLLPDVNQLTQPGLQGARFGAFATYRLWIQTPGTYYVWLRGRAPNGSGNTVNVGLDREFPTSGDGIGPFSTTDFTWVTLAENSQLLTLSIPTAGFHSLYLSKSEDGVMIDKVVLTRDDGYTPTGAGPASTLRETPALPDLVLRGSASPSLIQQGDQTRITLEVENLGSDDAAASTFDATIPPGASLESLDSSVGTISSAGDSITWQLPSMPLGGTASAFLDFGADAPTTGTLSLLAELSGPSIETRVSNNRLTISFHVNDPPRVEGTRELIADEGGQTLVTPGNLKAADGDDSPAGLVFEIVLPPLHGNFMRNASVLSTGDSFTQADIDADSISYRHGGSETTTDEATLMLSDGQGGSFGPFTFTVSINPGEDPAGLEGWMVFQE